MTTIFDLEAERYRKLLGWDRNKKVNGLKDLPFRLNLGQDLEYQSNAKAFYRFLEKHKNKPTLEQVIIFLENRNII